MYNTNRMYNTKHILYAIYNTSIINAIISTNFTYSFLFIYFLYAANQLKINTCGSH